MGELLAIQFIGIYGLLAAGITNADYALVQEGCTAQSPRFPLLYEKHKELRAAPMTQQQHRVALAVKNKEQNLYLEAMIQEIDLSGNGVCDLIVTTTDPVSAGGDSDVLSTVYIATKKHWKRIGAITAAKSDYPSELDLIRAPADADFAFSEFIAIHQQTTGKTYLLAWRHERVTNGFNGYRIYYIDVESGALRQLDKWNGDGKKLYTAFKAMNAPSGTRYFDKNVELTELRAVCTNVPTNNVGLTEACKDFKR